VKAEFSAGIAIKLAARTCVFDGTRDSSRGTPLSQKS
jgi:hypothetical protein